MNKRTRARRRQQRERAVLANGMIQPGAPLPVVSTPVPAVALLKLDLGCGANKREGFLGVDAIAFPGVDVVADLKERWPWPDASVEEAHSSHTIEHLDSWERVHFVNELYRVLVPGGKATIIVPHWASCRAYGDPSHRWPPVSEFWFYYLLRSWRLGDPAQGIPGNAPHTDIAHEPRGFSCDFDAQWGYSLHPQIALRNPDAQQFATGFYKEAVQDLIATLTRRPS